MAAEENCSSFSEIRKRDARLFVSGGEAARAWLDGSRDATLVEALDSSLADIPTDAREPLVFGFVNALSYVIPEPGESVRPPNAPADAGEAVLTLLRDVIVAAGAARQLGCIRCSTNEARNAIGMLADLADTIDQELSGFAVDAAEVAYLLPARSRAERTARDELIALRPLRLRLVALLADPAETETPQGV